MTTVKALREWLAAYPDDHEVAIDDGGLTVQVAAPGSDWAAAALEVGGWPTADDEAETCDECGAETPGNFGVSRHHDPSCSLYGDEDEADAADRRAGQEGTCPICFCDLHAGQCPEGHAQPVEK